MAILFQRSLRDRVVGRAIFYLGVVLFLFVFDQLQGQAKERIAKETEKEVKSLLYSE